MFGYLYALEVQSEGGPLLSLWSMVYLCIAFVIYFTPIFYFQRRVEGTINLINPRVFRGLCLFLMVGGIFSLIVFFPKAVYALNFGAAKFRQGLQSGNVSVFNGSVLSTIAVGFSSFFGLCQLLAFLVLVTKSFGRFSGLVAFGLFVASTAYILNVFAFAGRDGIVFWGISFVFCYVFVSRWAILRIPKLIWATIIVFCAVAGAGFLLITINRFDDPFYVFSYGAQQLYEFNAIFVIDPPLHHGWNAFREIYSAIGVGGDVGRKADWNYYLSNDVKPWTFKFFIGSLLKDFGKIGTLGFLGVFSALVFLWAAKKRPSDSVTKVVPLDHVLLIYLYCQIGFMGVFYFKHSSLNAYLVVYVFLLLLLRLMRLLNVRWLVGFAPGVKR